MFILGLHGQAGVGKDTIAQAIAKYLPEDTVKLFAFADGVKKTAMVKFNLTEDQVYTQEGKLEHIESLGMTVREILEIEGTEATRDIYGQEFWIWRLQQELLQAHEQGIKVAIITDLRFENEAKFVQENQGVVCGVYRDLEKQLATETHRSAQPLPHSMIQVHWDNNATMEELDIAAKSLSETIKEHLL